MSSTKHYPTIGTNSTPFYVPISSEPEVVQTETGYFYIQIYGAQAAFAGPWWIGAQNLTVTSKVNLHLGDRYKELGNQDLVSILQCRELSKNTAVQLGFSPILVDFVPAKMKKVSISIQYLVNTQNYLKEVLALITDKDLLVPISIAPGAAIVARTVGNLAEKLLSALMPQEARQPILQFSGEFDLADEGLKEGFYIILGSHRPENPLPSRIDTLEVGKGGDLLIRGKSVTQLSYVILKVGCIKAIRDRFTSDNPWRSKLQEVRRLATDYAGDPFASPDANQKKEFWEKECLPRLREASALLKSDPNFLDSEIELIYRSAHRECIELITAKDTTRKSARQSLADTWQPDEQADLKFLGIPVEENLDSKLAQYAEQLYKARKTIKEVMVDQG